MKYKHNIIANKLLSFLVALFISISFSSSVFAAGVSLVINEQTCFGGTGEAVTFLIAVTNAPYNLTSLGFKISYDESVLTYDQYSRGELTRDFTMFDVNKRQGGFLQVGGMDLGTGIASGVSGNVLELTFMVQKCEATTLRLVELVDGLAGWPVNEGRLLTSNSTSTPVSPSYSTSTQVYPEVCDGIDNDGNGQIDEEGSQGCAPYYKDADGDGYGLGSDSRCLCAANVAGRYTSTNAGDCNDGDPKVSPGATEIADGKDNNCNGQIDENPNSSPVTPYSQGTPYSSGMPYSPSTLYSPTMPYYSSGTPYSSTMPYSSGTPSSGIPYSPFTSSSGGGLYNIPSYGNYGGYGANIGGLSTYTGGYGYGSNTGGYGYGSNIGSSSFGGLSYTPSLLTYSTNLAFGGGLGGYSGSALGGLYSSPVLGNYGGYNSTYTGGYNTYPGVYGYSNSGINSGIGSFLGGSLSYTPPTSFSTNFLFGGLF